MKSWRACLWEISLMCTFWGQRDSLHPDLSAGHDEGASGLGFGGAISACIGIVCRTG